MSYVDFELTDFLEDSDFKKWVYSPTQAREQFWKEFLASHPEKSEIIENAKSTLLLIEEDFVRNYPGEKTVEGMWDKITDARTEQLPVKKSSAFWIYLSSAAAAAIVLGMIWFNKTELDQIPVSYHERVAKSAEKLIETKNKTSKALLVQLPDQSSVLLQPNSSLSYAENFTAKDSREVYLLGEGFFQVTKNPKKPFLVYANEVVTRVLGTSFTVKAFENAPEIVVEVKTGKVSVFAIGHDENLDSKQFDSSRAIVLTPNQKVLYTRADETIKKYLVDAPEMIATDFAAPPILEFKDAKVSEIFANLQQSYQIEIQYNREQLDNCLLTASFTNESLYDKIDLICKGIEAEFRIENGKIIINGRGCH